MGVKSMLRWVNPKGVQPTPQDEEKIQQAIEALLGKVLVKEKMWAVKLQYLRQSAATATDRRGLKDIWYVTFSEQPDSCFLCNRPDKQAVEASVSMLPLLEKKIDYQTKISVKFEGKRWRMGDFAVKLGAVTQTGGSGSNFKGHMVEVEYTPLQHRDIAEPIMQEFISHLIHSVPPNPAGRLEPVAYNAADSRTLPAEFSLLHSCLQYVELAAILLRAR